MDFREMVRAALQLTLVPLKPLRSRNANAPHLHSLPTFLLIGAPQSGTTWLYENLKGHPSVNLPIKEVCYFSHRFHRSPKWYANLFDASLPIRGDMTPHYIRLSRERIRLAHEMLPEARLVLILRDPVERAWSQARRKIAGPFTVDNVNRVLNDSTAYRPWFDSKIDNSSASLGLENWLTYFPLENLLVIPFELISSNPVLVIRGVLSHLGASQETFNFNHLERSPVNRNPTAGMPRSVAEMLEERYERERERREKLLSFISVLRPNELEF